MGQGIMVVGARGFRVFTTYFFASRNSEKSRGKYLVIKIPSNRIISYLSLILCAFLCVLLFSVKGEVRKGLWMVFHRFLVTS